MTTLRKIDDTWERADDLVQFWPEVKKAIDQLLGAATSDDAKGAIPAIFRLRYFENFAVPLLLNDRLPFDPVPDGTPEWIPTSYDPNDEKGCNWFEFPGMAIQFGKVLSHPTIKSKHRPIIDAVRYGQVESLKTGLRELKRIVDAEYEVATKAVVFLRGFLDSQLRWGLQFYFANLSGNPVVVHPTARLYVKDKAGLRATEDCYLAVVKEDKDEGTEYWADTKSPIVVRGHDDARIVLITRKRQGEMALGNAIRESYSRGEATARVELVVTKVGLLKKQRIRTKWTPFKSTVMTKGELADVAT